MPIMGMTMISPSLPLIKGDLNSSFSDTQIVLSIYFLFLAIGQLFAGPLSDRFGRKPLVVYGSLIAQTKTEFFYNVMVISFFIGSIQSASRVMMTKLLYKTDLGKGFGLFSFSGRITAFAGPLMVGTLTYMYSQRIGFLSHSYLLIIRFVLMLSVWNV